MAYNLVLIHSPLIGPYSWRPVADELERSGHRTLIPALLPVLDASSNFADAIAQRVEDTVRKASLPAPFLLLAHSAAGAYLPVIGSKLDQEISGYIFVDARLPESGASLADQDPPQAEEHRRRIVKEGVLPPWSEWFGEEAMVEVIPDAEQRRHFVSELRSIPLALYHEKITYPSDWLAAPCAYLQLSEFYKPLADQASERGWPTMTIDTSTTTLLCYKPSKRSSVRLR